MIFDPVFLVIVLLIYVNRCTVWSFYVQVVYEFNFDNAQYDEILGLKEKGLKSVVIIPVGYRAEEDVYQNLAKVRTPLEDLIVDM